MMYKIMSNVCAHMNADGDILSPTQRLLQSNTVHASELIPQKIRSKISSYDLCVDKKSMYENPDHACRGDIYVDVDGSLSVIEQRQLIDGLMHIGNNDPFSILAPVVIRNSPDNEHASVIPDEENIVYNKKENAFIGVCAQIATDDVKGSYRNADSIAKALNYSINPLGLKTVFADGSVYDTKTMARNHYLLFQKTSRFHNDRFSYDTFINSVKNGFRSDKLYPNCDAAISVIPINREKGLVGSVSLENVQMAGKYISDIITCAEQNSDLLLFLCQARKNPFFVNGISCGKDIGNLKIVSDMQTMFPIHANVSTIESSTTQELSVGWKKANAITVNVSSDDKLSLTKLHQHAYDILSDINEMFGCDEASPIALDMFVGAKIKTDDSFAESLIIRIKETDDFDFYSDQCYNYFSDAISEYSELDGLSISNSRLRPFVADIKSSQKLKPISVVFNHGEVSNTKQIDTDLIPDVTSELEHNEQQINF